MTGYNISINDNYIVVKKLLLTTLTRTTGTVIKCREHAVIRNKIYTYIPTHRQREKKGGRECEKIIEGVGVVIKRGVVK